MKRFLPLALLLVACGPSENPAPAPTTLVKDRTEKPVEKIDGNPSRVNQLKDLKTVEMDVKGHKIKAWVMDDDSKRSEGMMFLEDKDVKDDEGMLFVFDGPQTVAEGRGFWMHNTLIPLDITYLTPKGKVLNVGQGKPQDDTTVKADGDFQYVLETKAGIMAKLGVKPGDTIPIPKLP